MIGGRVELGTHPQGRHHRRPGPAPDRHRSRRHRRLPHRAPGADHRRRRLHRLRARPAGAPLRAGAAGMLDRDESALHAVQLSIHGHGLLDGEDTVLDDIRDFEALDAVFDASPARDRLPRRRAQAPPAARALPGRGLEDQRRGHPQRPRGRRPTRRGALRQHLHRQGRRRRRACSATTKRLAEQVTAWYAETTGRRYISVRFGNVLGSRGSMLHTFNTQIDAGRTDHGDPPRRHPLLHDDPRGLRAGRPGRRDRSARRRARARHGRAGQDPRRRPPHDRARRASGSRSPSPASARARSCTRCSSPTTRRPAPTKHPMVRSVSLSHPCDPADARPSDGARVTERIYMSSPDVGQAEEDALVRAIRSGWVAPLGPEVDAFEADIAAYADRGARRRPVVRHRCAAPGAARAWACCPDSVVITSSMTFAATANAITYCGATRSSSTPTSRATSTPHCSSRRSPTSSPQGADISRHRPGRPARQGRRPRGHRHDRGRATTSRSWWTPPSPSGRPATDGPPAPRATARSCRSTATRS